MRILVVKLSSIGDIWHAVPAVARLHEDLGAQIDWVVNAEYAPLVERITCVSRVIPFQRKRFFSSLPTFLPELRAEVYDAVVDVQGLFKSGVVAGLARGPVTGPRWSREGAWLFYRHRVGERDPMRHAVERCLDVAEALGASREPICYPVHFPRHALQGEGPHVALAPVSRWITKNWPLENYCELASRLLESGLAGHIHVIGGPGDVSVCQQVCDAVAKGGATNWAGRLSLVESGGLLQAVDLLLANDSGPLHMAVAAGTRTVSFYGPTDPARTGPYGVSHTVLQAPMPCLGCYQRLCRERQQMCMRSIAVDRVCNAVASLLR
jgi:heptosyltransferase-1